MDIPGLVVFARMRANVGWEGHVRMALIEAVAPTLLEEENIGYAIHQSTADPRLFLLYEQWTDKAALESHKRQPHFTELAERLKEALEAPVEIIETQMIGGEVAPAATGE
ncbi:MAG TPA: putative quinol monooxygenase [Candidatus Acidoferrum sp.]|nr:putative quinol monooxygenase [Candidatus Acidoferrum sp.]